ncbi:alpha amylase C-terminal domain-containing protein [Candidatus Saccharibacteria bacterium]|nr:alpha amylase C-terminal domain-containing protein [Candidatus Saccharibacteria bacterium]
MANKKYKIFDIDPWLAPYESDIDLRMQHYWDMRHALVGDGDMASFANGYMFFGFAQTKDGWVYREWAPGADEMHLIGDFNNWDRLANPMHRTESGIWEVKIKGRDKIKHGQKVKVQVTRRGRKFDRIPLYMNHVVQDKLTRGFVGEIWAPEKKFRWTDTGWRDAKTDSLLIYEAHVGMAQEKEGIGTYREFADKILPRIVDEGYTAVQLMAIQEHPYYASFGYQVSNFYAASSWYGDPDDLKYLINKAHKLGLKVLLDIVHSHAIKNTAEGINMFDGTFNQFFMTGDAGDHPAWGTKLFNYAKHEVIHFLLSNLKFWMEEYHFDGFRFDGVTSMCYHHHGLGVDFSDYKQYFDVFTNTDAITYLQLANALIHEVNPNAITVAEEMSGMPGMCIPIEDGGIGFDYRLAMGIPDYWIKTLTKEKDENRDMHKMWHELTTRRPAEKSIGYSESHDQALVGDKTLIFRMADAEMYTGMDKAYHSPVIDRAIEMHKLIRFATMTLSCEAYLNFMGNEFGHPEWIDFPREGNGWSFKYARRQWSLADDGFLKYEWLLNFDKAMVNFAKKNKVLQKNVAENLWLDEKTKIMAFARGDLLYVFNFHPTESATNFFLHAHTTGVGEYRAIFSTDDADFGGQNRIDKKYVYSTVSDKRGLGFEIYLPCRTAVVFRKKK